MSSNVREMPTTTPIRRAFARSRPPIVLAAMVLLASSLAATNCSIYDLGSLESGGARGAGGAAGESGSTTDVTSSGSGGAGGMGGSDPQSMGGTAGTMTDEYGAAPSGTTGTTTGAGGSPVGTSTGGGSGLGGEAGMGGLDASIPDAVLDAGQPDTGPEFHPVCGPGDCKLVFVSSMSIPANAGSAANFDRICQKLANGRNFAGTWKAWVSDQASTVAARMTQASVPYRLLNGSTIALDWPDLASGNLRHPINVREDGTTLSIAVEVWTGTLGPGSRATYHCNNWTMMSGSAIVGSTEVTSVGWTAAHQQYCSTPTVHLYCFEQ
jgi:hypothetical protein